MSEESTTSQPASKKPGFQFRISTLMVLILIVGIFAGLLTNEYRSLSKFRSIVSRLNQFLPNEMNEFILSSPDIAVGIGANQLENDRTDFQSFESVFGSSRFSMVYSASWPQRQNEKVYVGVSGEWQFLSMAPTIKIHDFGLEDNKLVVERLAKFIQDEFGITATTVKTDNKD